MTDAVGEAIPQMIVQPVEMADILIASGFAELDLDDDDSAIAPLDDQVDLAVSLLGAQMANPRGRGFGVDAERFGGQRLEQRFEPCAGGGGHPNFLTLQQCSPSNTHESRGEGGVHQMMPRRTPERLEGVQPWNPRGDRVEHEDAP